MQQKAQRRYTLSTRGGNTPPQASEIKEIQDKLTNEINTTQNKINDYSELCKPISPENAIGRVSRMDAINNKSIVEAALREAKYKMEQLLLMKRKINDVDFGKCLKCKNNIPFERLIIRPESRLCIRCAK